MRKIMKEYNDITEIHNIYTYLVISLNIMFLYCLVICIINQYLYINTSVNPIKGSLRLKNPHIFLYVKFRMLKVFSHFFEDIQPYYFY